MLLLFYIGENLYAIDTDPVIEIVPMVLLRKIQPAPDHIAGVFNYRGSIVPVIDLCRLIRGTPCQACYSTRIVMVNYRINAHSPADRNSENGFQPQEKLQEKDRQQRQFGLMVERVTETLKISENQIKTTKNISNSPYLGELFVDEERMIQTVNWEQLVKDAEQQTLAIGGDGQANGAGRN